MDNTTNQEPSSNVVQLPLRYDIARAFPELDLRGTDRLAQAERLSNMVRHQLWLAYKEALKTGDEHEAEWLLHLHNATMVSHRLWRELTDKNGDG